MLRCLIVGAGRGLDPRPVEGGGYLWGRGEPVVQPAVPHELRGGSAYEALYLVVDGGVGHCGVDDGGCGRASIR